MTTVDSQTCAIEPVVRVEGVNVQALDHPSNLHRLGVTDVVVRADPGRQGVIVRVVAIQGRITIPCPQPTPCLTAIEGAEDILQIG